MYVPQSGAKINICNTLKNYSSILVSYTSLIKRQGKKKITKIKR
jgi:hypothetical protein